jgi:dihydrofolate reductase
MNQAKISIVAAIGSGNRALGKDNKLIWAIPADLKRFKQLTTGHPIIMGRKTFESIGRPLPNRTNIIITRNADYKIDGCLITNSLEAAISKAREIDQQEIFIIGGAEIYKQALPFTDKLYLTIIQEEKEGDVFFPDYSEFTKEFFREEHIESEPHYILLELEK